MISLRLCGGVSQWRIENARSPSAEALCADVRLRTRPRFLLYDRDSRYGKIFDRRSNNLGIMQIRTPFRSPRANAIAER
jgi:hypothetical protein